MVQIQVNIPAMPDQFAGFIPRLLRQHADQHRGRKHIEAKAQPKVAAALKQQPAENTIGNMKLIGFVARRQRHLV